MIITKASSVLFPDDFEAHTQSIEEILNPDDDTTTTPSPPSPEKEEDPSGNVVHDSWDDIYGDSSQGLSIMILKIALS